ncbi:hypothetical protein D3C78_1182350 [compost metagenome]
MMPSHHLRHHLDWALVIKTLARPNIQFIRNGIQLLLAMPRQVGALGQVLPNQAVDVFVAAALPGAMRVAESNSHSGTLGDVGVTHHFPALVIGQRFTRCQRHAVQGGTETFDRRSRCGVMHLDQHQVTRAAL